MANNTATTNPTVTVSDKKKFFEKAMEESIHPSPKPGKSLVLFIQLVYIRSLVLSIVLVCYMLKNQCREFPLYFYSNCLRAYIAYNKNILVRLIKEKLFWGTLSHPPLKDG